jgi:antitoxin HigA-1
MTKKLRPVHPGEELREGFLVPMKLSPYAVARVVGVQRTRIERSGATPVFWMGLQAQYEIERAEDEIGAGLNKIAPITRSAITTGVTS